MANNPHVTRILDAIQTLEEIGGPDTTEEYLDILNLIKCDINTRIINATRTQASTMDKMQLIYAILQKKLGIYRNSRGAKLAMKLNAMSMDDLRSEYIKVSVSG